MQDGTDGDTREVCLRMMKPVTAVGTRGLSTRPRLKKTIAETARTRYVVRVRSVPASVLDLACCLNPPAGCFGEIISRPSNSKGRSCDNSERGGARPPPKISAGLAAGEELDRGLRPEPCR